jgi:hypothetical protein
VDVVPVCSGAAHESLDLAKRACDGIKEVGATELEADVDARKFRAVNGMGWGVEVTRILM